MYVGGLISDKLEPYFLPTKGCVAGIGAIICFPFLIFAFSVVDDFWISILLYTIGCFFGEAYVGPNVSMIQSLFNGKCP